MFMKRYYGLVITLCFAMFLFACDSEDGLFLDHDGAVEFQIPAICDNETFVSLELATNVADAFFGRQNGNLRRASLQRSIVSSETVRDSNGDPVMYVINYSEGGFIIVGATRNYYPVLAYSDENSFEFLPDMGPVAIWLDEVTEAIRTSAAIDEETKQSIRAEWNLYEVSNAQTPTSSSQIISYCPFMVAAFSERIHELYVQYHHLGWNFFYSLEDAMGYGSMSYSDWLYLIDLANRNSSPPEYTIIVSRNVDHSRMIGPLLTTRWSQNSPFNEVCCASSVPAGCGPVAMAKILAYHKRPAVLTFNGHTIDWNNLPNNSSHVSGTSVPHLIAATRSASNTGWLPPPINASWTMPGNIVSGLRSYGYIVERRNHNLNEVSGELLTHQRPVIMVGFPGALNPNGHYWICDGFNQFRVESQYFIEFINANTY